MGLQFGTATIKTGKQHTFQFKNYTEAGKEQFLTKFLVGISGYQLAFNDRSEQMIEMDLKPSIISSSTGSHGNSTVTVKLETTFTGKFNNTGDADYCWAHVTVLGWMGTEDNTLFMASTSEISDGTTSVKYNTGRSIISSNAILTGFNTYFTESGDQTYDQVTSIKVGAAVADAVTVDANLTSSRYIKASATVKLIGTSGYTGHGSIYAGLLAQIAADPFLEIQTQSYSLGDTKSGLKKGDLHSITFQKKIKAATVLVQGFHAAYPDDYEVACLRAGCLDYDYGKNHVEFGVDSIDDKTVSFYLNETMWRYGLSDGHWSTTNNLTLVIIGIYDEPGNTNNPGSIGNDDYYMSCPEKPYNL